jgi:cytochrome c oxidase subunit 1
VGALRDGADPGAGDAGARHHALLLFVERFMHIGIFDPNLGGDPVLFQHFFWFYSHPAVYIMILPGMGVISEIIGLLAQAASSATGSSPTRASRIALSASWSGATTCSSSGQSKLANMVFSA